MIPGDIGMQVTPHALYAIVIGTIRRQEVQYDSTIQSRQSGLGLETAVNAIVVEDQMDTFRLRIIGHRLLFLRTAQGARPTRTLGNLG